jgi:hypothetical protein
MYELSAFRSPFSEYDQQFSSRPLSLFEESIVSGMRPTVPTDCPYSELMIRVCLYFENPIVFCFLFFVFCFLFFVFCFLFFVFCFLFLAFDFYFLFFFVDGLLIIFSTIVLEFRS